MKGIYVDIGGNTKLYCRIYGTLGAESIVLLHGWAGSSLIWERYAKLLPKGFGAVAFDLKGFGNSSKPENGYGLPTLADEVYRAAKKLGLKHAIVVGHSMGGQVAMYMAIRYKRFVNKLVVVDSAEKPSRLVPLWVKEANRDYKSLVIRVVASLFDSISKKELDRFTHEGLKMSKSSVIGTLRAIMRIRLEGRLKEIGCSTLLIFGVHDKNRSISELRGLNKKLKGSKLVIIKKSKHCPMYENTKSFSHYLNKFITNQ